MPRSSFAARSVLLRPLLKRKRLDANLTQHALARRLQRPQSFVAKYENGERRLDLLEFIEIADAIGFDPGQFIIEFRKLQQASGKGSRAEGRGRFLER